ncbi:MAG: hypothetical protein AAF543_05955 [Pseudomonadota bacterium]
MTASQSAALADKAPALSAPEEEVKLTLPETTMFVVGTSGVLWALIYGAFNALFG